MSTGLLPERDEAGGGSGVGAAAGGEPQRPWHVQPPTAAPTQGLKRRDVTGLQQSDGIHAVQEERSQSGVLLAAWDCGELEQTCSLGRTSAPPWHPREWHRC